MLAAAATTGETAAALRGAAVMVASSREAVAMAVSDPLLASTVVKRATEAPIAISHERLALATTAVKKDTCPESALPAVPAVASDPVVSVETAHATPAARPAT